MRFAWSVWSIGYFATCAAAVGLALLVLVRGRGAVRPPLVGLALGLAATEAALGIIRLAVDVDTALRCGRIQVALGALNSPLAVWFVAAMLGRPRHRLVWVSSVAALAAAALALMSPSVIAAARPGLFGFRMVAGRLFPAVMAATSLWMVMPPYLAVRWQREPRSAVREQVRLVLVTAALGTLSLIDLLPLIGVSVPPVGWLPLGAALAVLWTAVLRNRLLDLRLAARRLLLWIALTFVGALPFVAAALALRRRWPIDDPWPLALAAAAFLLVMRGYLTVIQPRVDRLVGRRSRDLAVEMAVLVSQAATLQTVDALGRAVDRFLGALDRRLAALVVIDDTGRPRVALSAWGSVPAPSRGSPLLHELARARAPISVERVRGPARAEIERACVRWGAEFLAPLVEGEQLLGLIAIAPRRDGGLADVLEVEAIDRMGVVVTAALASARLYERLQSLSAELEQKAQARSSSLARALADLRGAEARLFQSEKLAALGQIVAGVAADLRDQVGAVLAAATALRGDAELLAHAAAAAVRLPDPRFDEVARDLVPLLDAVGEGARRAVAITGDLAGFAPSDGPPEPGRRAPRALDGLVDATLKLLGARLDGIAVVRHYDATVPQVPVEEGPIGQVILNLVLNAAEAMRGTGTLTLATRVCDNALVEIAVGDTGPGIAAELLGRIFEPFFSTKGPTSGTGLGLSVSFGIVQRHGGRLLVDSVVGRGTTFRVQLPVA